MERRLAAIFAADLVAYSRLMEANEETTLARLKALRQTIDGLIANHRGRVFAAAGDSVLAEFASPVQAVRCAVAVQRDLLARNRPQPKQQRMRFRIGVNLGDVIVEGDDLFGDGVNFAARLEALAPPGGICISGPVFDQVEGELNCGFEDLGPQTVKNIVKPVRVYRVRMHDARHPGAPRRPGVTALPNRPSVAVLPFVNMSGDPAQAYFSDGLTEDIITALAAWRSFPVVARNSSFVYRDRAVDVKQIGHELGARYVVEGSVRKAGNRLRITAELIDAVSGHAIWAERLDREFEDVFAIQDELARRIATTIVPELQRSEQRRTVAKRTEDLDAWDLCLRGVAALNELTADGNARARALFRRATELDPNYGDAFALMAHSHLRDLLIEAVDTRDPTVAEALVAAQRAVALNDASSYAHVVLAQAYLWQDDHPLAIAETRRAAELNPYAGDIMHALGNRLDLAGDPGGISMMEQAQRLNPGDPQRSVSLLLLARAYLNAGAYDKAAAAAQDSIHRRPDYPQAHYVLALALGHRGKYDEARAALDTCERLRPGFVERRADWQPYPDPANNDRLRAGLRDAGLVDQGE